MLTFAAIQSRSGLPDHLPFPAADGHQGDFFDGTASMYERGSLIGRGPPRETCNDPYRPSLRWVARYVS